MKGRDGLLTGYKSVMMDNDLNHILDIMKGMTGYIYIYYTDRNIENGQRIVREA